MANGDGIYETCKGCGELKDEFDVLPRYVQLLLSIVLLAPLPRKVCRSCASKYLAIFYGIVPVATIGLVIVVAYFFRK